MTHYFCETLTKLLSEARPAETIVYYTSTAPYDVTNAIFLLGAFLVTRLGATPEQAWAPFSGMSGSLLRPYRDATWCRSTYDLTLLHCYQGLKKAMDSGLYEPEDFDLEEYFYYDFPRNGDMHEVVKGKFFAFKGPSDMKQRFATKRPSDYFEVFRAMGIEAVVRLNKKEYEEEQVIEAGFKHHDLFFHDCSTPSDEIAHRFLCLAEEATGALAVHCLAGLGRTGTLIALYMMKHMHFTANEAIAWLRIARPGSVIGPQQQYLQCQEKRMWALGLKGSTGLGLDARDGDCAEFEIDVPAPSASDSDSSAATLAEQITKGMMLRDRRTGGWREKSAETSAATVTATTPQRFPSAPHVASSVAHFIVPQVEKRCSGRFTSNRLAHTDTAPHISGALSHRHNNKSFSGAVRGPTSRLWHGKKRFSATSVDNYLQVSPSPSALSPPAVCKRV